MLRMCARVRANAKVHACARPGARSCTCLCAPAHTRAQVRAPTLATNSKYRSLSPSLFSNARTAAYPPMHPHARSLMDERIRSLACSRRCMHGLS
eukprot:1356328-Alexandrium_andersonii.AAC.1